MLLSSSDFGCDQAVNEQNFHIFYLLVAAANSAHATHSVQRCEALRVLHAAGDEKPAFAFLRMSDGMQLAGAEAEAKASELAGVAEALCTLGVNAEARRTPMCGP